MNRHVPRILTGTGTQVMTRRDITAIEPESRTFNQHASPVAGKLLCAADGEERGWGEGTKVVVTEGFVEGGFAVREGEELFADEGGGG